MQVKASLNKNGVSYTGSFAVSLLQYYTWKGEGLGYPAGPVPRRVYPGTEESTFKMAHSHVWQVGADCRPGAQLGLWFRALHFSPWGPVRGLLVLPHSMVTGFYKWASRRARHFYDPTLKVTLHHFHCTVLVEAVPGAAQVLGQETNIPPLGQKRENNTHCKGGTWSGRRGDYLQKTQYTITKSKLTLLAVQ